MNVLFVRLFDSNSPPGVEILNLRIRPCNVRGESPGELEVEVLHSNSSSLMIGGLPHRSRVPSKNMNFTRSHRE
eukprot:scaffold41246_cov292-Skeletonema_marinoi.AAC.1